jgi:hypothetical protein
VVAVNVAVAAMISGFLSLQGGWTAAELVAAPIAAAAVAVSASDVRIGGHRGQPIDPPPLVAVFREKFE